MANDLPPSYRVLPNGTLDFGFGGLKRAAWNFDIGTARILDGIYRPGAVAVIAHGRIIGTKGATFQALDTTGHKRSYSANEIARIVRQHMPPIRNPTVLLLTCHSAAGTQPLARDLARELCVTVRGGSNKINMSGNANITTDDWVLPAVARHKPLEDSLANDPLANLTGKSVWVDFKPNGRAVAMEQTYAFGLIRSDGPRMGFADAESTVEIEYPRVLTLSER